ncbi:hypothetical protein [Moorena sp. SIO4G3]|uniref:hypothetical protein n=1 Tax=Moorena sp. SIO4G3 TaxID=2607821 RepID=UPI0025CEBCB0|nr:hypothetical protein [Moorena sp. SIO4G3]
MRPKTRNSVPKEIENRYITIPIRVGIVRIFIPFSLLPVPCSLFPVPWGAGLALLKH